MPIFSVITPVYNGEKFVSRCYDNLLDQTNTDWEWIVVNDGSTDGTLDELKKISDPRIRLVTYPKNMGRGYARQRAIDACQGDWMVIWDVDDLNFPDRLENILKARTEGHDFFCSYVVTCTNSLVIKGIKGFFPSSHGLPNTFVHPTMACSLNIARKIGYDPNVSTGEDSEILWVLPSNYSGMWCKNVLVIYQEDREVNLQKAIDCNLGHFKLLKKTYKVKKLRMTRLDYIYQCCKYNIKLAFLYLLKLNPDLYLKSVSHRSYGEVNPQYDMSNDQLAYIEKYKMKYVNNAE